MYNFFLFESFLIVINAAEKYNLPKLKEFCDKRMRSICNAKNALDLLKIAKMHQMPIATKAIGDFIKGNVDKVVENFGI